MWKLGQPTKWERPWPRSYDSCHEPNNRTTEEDTDNVKRSEVDEKTLQQTITQYPSRIYLKKFLLKLPRRPEATRLASLGQSSSQPHEEITKML